jgi:hypothetical protein
MRRVLIVIVAERATAALAVPVALATSAHFKTADASVNDGGTLDVS